MINMKELLVDKVVNFDTSLSISELVYQQWYIRVKLKNPITEKTMPLVYVLNNRVSIVGSVRVYEFKRKLDNKLICMYVNSDNKIIDVTDGDASDWCINGEVVNFLLTREPKPQEVFEEVDIFQLYLFDLDKIIQNTIPRKLL